MGGSRRFGSHGRMCVTSDHSLSLLDSMIHDFSFPFVAFHLFERFHEIESIDISLGIFHSFLSRDLFERIAALFHSLTGGTNKELGEPSSVLDNVPGGRHWNTHT